MNECLSCGRCSDADVRCPEDGELTTCAFEGPRTLDGRYRLDTRLGSGGMGTVYRGTHLELRREVAVKLVRFNDPGMALSERFRLEALALARLEHPAIVRVADFGVDPRGSGLAYLVMDLVSGRNLFDELRPRALPIGRALEIFASLADGIDHAHSRGVLHRDLKPANVLLPESGDPPARILDFGLAQLRTGDEPATRHRPRRPLPHGAFRIDAPTRSSPLTEDGMLVGTPAYMAPEVLSGDPSTTASDLYSFGVVLYEAFTGRHPAMATPPDSARPERPSKLRRAIPAEADEPILALIAEDPHDRPESARASIVALRRAFDSASRRESEAAGRRELRRRTPGLLAAAALGAVLLAFLPPVRLAEERLSDLRLLLAKSRPPDSRILIVSIDDATLDSDGAPLAEQGDRVGEFVSAALDGGATTVAVDITPFEGWRKSDRWNDAILRHPDRLVLAASSIRGSVLGPESVDPLVSAALGPTRVSNLYAFANCEPDRDGVLRRMRLTFTDATGQRRETLAIRAAGIAGPLSPAPEPRPRIDYSIDASRFDRISFRDALSLARRDPGRFLGRIVLLGGEFAGSGDSVLHGPRIGADEGDWSGLAIQALMTATALARFPVRTLTGPFVLLPLVFAAATAGAFLGVASHRRGLLYSISGIVLFLVTGFVGSGHARLLVPLVSPSVAAFAALFLFRHLARTRVETTREVPMSLFRFATAATVLLAVAPLAAATAPEAPVAIVSLLAPTATETPAAGAAREIHLFDRLRTGSKVEVGTGGRAVVAWLSGKRWSLEAGSSVRIGEQGPEILAGKASPLPAVPTVPKVSPIAASERTTGRAGAVRIRGGEPTSAPKLRPGSGEGLILAEGARLRFTPVGGADRYKVQIENEEGKLLLDLETRSGDLSVPSGILSSGAGYFWRVRALGGSGAGPWAEAFVETLGAADAAKRKAFADAAEKNGDAASWLLLAEVDRAYSLGTENCRDLELALPLAGNAAKEVEGALGASGCR